jgi:hypothetical protein
MNGKRNHALSADNSDGQDESTDHELHTDGGVSCRRSIGADSTVGTNVETELDLAELIEQHENIDWSNVPGVSAAEAAAWTARLIEARDAVLEGDV